MLKGVRELKKVGFIGLGNMGYSMTLNLIEAGYEVAANDVEEAKARDLERKGAIYTKNYEEIANHADVVITMLPASKHVEEACNSLLSLQ